MSEINAEQSRGKQCSDGSSPQNIFSSKRHLQVQEVTSILVNIQVKFMGFTLFFICIWIHYDEMSQFSLILVQCDCFLDSNDYEAKNQHKLTL